VKYYIVSLFGADHIELARFRVRAWNRREAFFTVMRQDEFYYWDAWVDDNQTNQDEEFVRVQVTQ